MEIPLFPLHTVLCPGIVLPLHIFEDRYRAMTRRLLETGGPFGVVYIREGREVGSGALSLAEVGALTEIREAGRYADGRYDVLAAATGRFAIESVDRTREPYLVASVRPLEDEVGDESRASRLASSAVGRFVRYLDLLRAREGETAEVLDIRVEVEFVGDDETATDRGSMVTETTAEPGSGAGATSTIEPVSITDDAPAADPDTIRQDLVIPDDPTVLSYLLSGIIQIELPRRQALLEAPTTADRLDSLVQLLDRELFLLRRRWRLLSPDPRLTGGVRRS